MINFIPVNKGLYEGGAGPNIADDGAGEEDRNANAPGMILMWSTVLVLGYCTKNVGINGEEEKTSNRHNTYYVAFLSYQ
jgi:hypothetical protein